MTIKRVMRVRFPLPALLTALGDDAEAVILEVSEAVSPALDEFHFSMEAFCNAIVFSEVPHCGDGLLPGVECFSQGKKRSEGAGLKLVDEE